MPTTARPHQSGRPVRWSGDQALAGAVYAIPAVALTWYDPQLGIPVAVGAVPAAILPRPPARRRRVVIFVVGALAGASMFLGGLLSQLPTALTAVALAAAVVGAAALAAATRLGMIVLTLCAPLVAAGLSYDDLATSALMFGLLSAGAAYAWLVSLCWPEREPQTPPDRRSPPVRELVGFGVRMGIAAAVGYAVAVLLQLGHPGWAPAACLLVARPQRDLLRTRGLGRVLSVTLGALAALALQEAGPPDWVYAAMTLVVLTAAAATAGSRWYVTSAFTTLFVVLMLVRGNPGAGVGVLNERVGETVLGVGLAFLFGLVIPPLVRHRPPGPPLRSM